MLQKRLIFAAAIITTVVFLLGSANVSASSTVLKKESQGNEVTSLQKDLVKLGYLNVEPTGFYGDATAEAVKKLQKEYGYDPDGITGQTTLALIDRLLGRAGNASSVSEETKNTDTKGNETKESNESNEGSKQAALKEGMEGREVTALQEKLIKLGYLETKSTGYFGEATATAVKRLQKKYGYEPDGVVGTGTFSLISKLSEQKNTAVKTEASTGSGKETPKSSGVSKTNYKLTWSEASKVFATGRIATVYDIESGLSFKVKRTYGHNHADCEALTAKDTATMKKIFGGVWDWDRRAVVITVGSRKLAASMAGMPHAGLDKYAANKRVSSRSGGYGRGSNLDAVKGNNMNGHFDIHFYRSRTHGTNRVDYEHQKMVRKAAEWAKENL